MRLGVFVLLFLPLSLCVLPEWIAAAGVGATRIGRNDGTSVGSESAEGLVELLRSRGIGNIRLRNADSTMLHAISSGSGSEAPVEVIVGVTNDEVVDIGVSSASAQRWIARNVVPHVPATNIVAIAVGSEVLASRQADQSTVLPFLVPAMRNLHAALSEVGLEKQIKLSAPQSARVLSSYFPPSSSATFNGGGITTDRAMASLLEFLASSESFFMLNLYPQDLEHDGVVGSAVDDPQSGQHHSSMVDRLTDAVSVAMNSLGHPKPGVIGIVMEWSRTSSSNAFRTDRNLRGVAVDIDPRFVEGFVIKPSQVEKNFVKKRAEAFSSRRFLMDSLQAKRQDEGGERRRRLVNKSWCVAKSDASTSSLQSSLDWACGSGGGVDCQPIQVGQSCFLPNTIVGHASYAFNSYYQQHSWASGSCDFGGIAETTTSDPSTASCLFSSSTSANGTPSTPTGTILPSVAPSSRPTWDRCRLLLASLILTFLIKRSLPEFQV